MNNKISVLKLRFLTGISFITILIPVLLFVLWSYCFNSQSNQADRVKMYNSYFPEFLNGRYTISLISLLLCFFGIILSSMYFHRRTSLLKFINIIVLVAGILMMMLSLFSLMWTSPEIENKIIIINSKYPYILAIFLGLTIPFIPEMEPFPILLGLIYFFWCKFIRPSNHPYFYLDYNLTLVFRQTDVSGN